MGVQPVVHTHPGYSAPRGQARGQQAHRASRARLGEDPRRPRLLAELHERLAKFGLELHPEKTRLIPFGRKVGNRWRHRGGSKPQAFNFLRLSACMPNEAEGGVFRAAADAAAAIAGEAQSPQMRSCGGAGTSPSLKQLAYVRSLVAGHVRYYGVPNNGHAIGVFRKAAAWLWRCSLRRRSQKTRLSWQRMRLHLDRWLPSARLCHPWPSQRLAYATQGRSRMPCCRPSGSVEGVISTAHSYSDCRCPCP